ncbi:MAG: caspase family protein [Hyphomicrobiaceae bacterium]
MSIGPFARIFGSVVALAATAAAMAGPGMAERRALLVGINVYDKLPTLEGSVADAQDIANSLRRQNVRDVMLLLDRQATRAAIEQAWRAMTARARPGDTLIFAYAGHGGQEPEAVPGSEADGMDEAFLLSGFDPRRGSPGYGERLVDNDLAVWFKEIEGRGLRVLFVADSCHSGTMTRSADPRARVLQRGVPPYGLPESLPKSEDFKPPYALTGALQISDGVLAAARIAEDDVPYVTFLAATQDGRKAPEVMIEGHRRGALSWAVARAFEGKADSNRDGKISRAELMAYVAPTVRQMSEAQQTPEMLPRFRSQDDIVIGDVPQQEHRRSDAALRFGFLNADPALQDAIARRLQGVTIVPPSEGADLVWDAREQTVLHSAGDPVAHDISEALLQGVVDRWLTLANLKLQAIARPLAMELVPSDARHPRKTIVTIRSEPMRLTYLTVFNLASDGTVQFIYPRAGDKLAFSAGTSFQEKLEVVPPFGADHLIAIASENAVPDLHRRLPMTRAADLPKLLAEALAGMDHQIGIQGLYTFDGGSQ